ncbi:SMP-30/gluconolactonase/LRE family protein [Candidatus Nitronereus thalassa]|uniref:SMP-30/gluconolactonase/LRE family protein n=1 Tax=Candidatus Nitronereus thalassa TaxID=3020898 RepID=A0ABU3K7Q5_9BACT|nr:SMP-30/gluconolactonase/LRE family protein [Candidatus Nitronereus thalassa]MDT7042410.1 SMP-30/gluconolactonase/LRE family protein [Candidatus Nitronereus thalassa]
MLKSIRAGTIGTIAGAGEPGCAGDGGLAIEALLNEPKNIAIDAVGNLYIADAENHLIRKVEVKTGVITTVAGMFMDGTVATGASEALASPFQEEDDDPLADPVSKPGDAYVQKSDLSGMVRYVGGTKSGDERFFGDGGPATKAALNFPSAVAVGEDGAVYIADTWNHRIRQVDPQTGVISTIAGTGQAKFYGDHGPAEKAALNEPVALALDGKGSLYIADQSNNRIRKIDLASGIISTIVGTGESGYNGDEAAGKDTAIAGPSGLAFDREGNLYIADTFSSRIRKLDQQTGTVETVVGGIGAYQFVEGDNESSSSLSRPYAIAIDSQNRLFITDSDNHLIRVWDLQKKEMSLLAGNGKAEFSGDGGSPTETSLNYPFGVALDAQGHVFIADTFSHRIRVIVP